MRWGLIPHWAGDTKTLNINARVETVATTPAFRDSFSKKRCLIPADGFYEWEPKEKGRSPHWIFRADGYPVGFAGRVVGLEEPGHRRVGSQLRHPDHRRHGSHRRASTTGCRWRWFPKSGKPGSIGT